MPFIRAFITLAGMDRYGFRAGASASAGPVIQWRIQGRGPGDPPPLFLDQTETRRAEKKFVSETGPPPTYRRVWMIPPTPPLNFI